MYVDDPQSNVGSSNHSSKKGNRPLRFKVDKFEDKRLILQANAVPDQTRRQREESFKLREELRYRKLVGKEKT